MKEKGTIIAIDYQQSSLLLKKSRNFLRKYLSNSHIYQKISQDVVNELFADEGERGEICREKFFSIFNLLGDYNIRPEFYFVKNQSFTYKNKKISFLVTELSTNPRKINFKAKKKIKRIM